MTFFSKSFSSVALVILMASCSVLDGLRHTQFTFYKNGKERKLVFKLPKGRVQENFRVGENEAKEQFYYLGDGSVFYVARHITWQTVNKHRIEGLGLSMQRSFSGKDSDGLYWKEIQLEDFRIGYAYVAANRVERFNEALSSVKIR